MTAPRSATDAPATARGALRALLARRPFRNLVVGQTLSAFGDWLVTVAMMALVLSLTGSSTAEAAILVLRLAPAAIAGPVATRVVQRWDRRTTMLSMDAARAVMVAVLPLVRAVWWVFLWAFLLEVASLVFLPARDAAIPDLAQDDEELGLANGLVLGSSYGMIPIGAGAFSVLAAVLPDRSGALVSATNLAFWIDAATFVASFVAISRIGRFAGATAGGDDQPERARFRDGFRIPLVRLLVVPATVAAIGIGSLFSLGIVFVRNVLGASDAQFGVLVVMFGVGAAAGLAVVQVRHVAGLRAVRIALAVQGVVIAVMSLSPVVEVAYLGAVLFGGSAAATLACAMAVIQSALDGETRVRAFAVFHVMLRVGLAFAAIAAGAAADLVGRLRWPLVGSVAPARVVLCLSGVVVLATALSARRLVTAAGRPLTVHAG